MTMIDLNIDADGIATLTLDMPERTMNVLNWQLGQALEAAVSRLADDSTVRGVIVTSGKSSFVAGADLSIMKDFVAPGVTPHQAADLIGRFGAVFRRLETLGKPVVGASPGTALGGGLELLLACHHRIAADVTGAQYGLPEVKLGLLPGAGGTQRLPRLIGVVKALPLLVEGRTLTTAEARELGLIHEVVPADQLLTAAKRALAEARVDPQAPWDRKGYRVPGGDAASAAVNDASTAANARMLARTQGLQPAPRAIASCVYEGIRVPLDRGLRIEQMYFAKLVQGAVAQSMIRTLFFARQSADKLVRRPSGEPSTPVRRLGILGSGFMGQGIAEVSAQVGIEVVLVDRDADTAAAAVEAIAQRLAKDVESGRLGAERRDALLARLHPAGDVAALASCELVIEAVFEDRALKRDLLAQVDRVLDDDAVLASNTSTLPIGSLDSASRRPARCVGLHFFSPVPKMALVEVIRSPRTSANTLARALDYVRQIRRTPIVVNDAHAFYTTRCVDAFVREGLRLLAEGVPPAVIDNAAVAAGMPVGPLTLGDEVGLDVMHHIQREAKEAGLLVAGDAATPVLEALHAAGRKGRKSGGGVYDYREGRRRAWAGLDALLHATGGSPAADIAPATVGERLIAIQVLVAADAFGQGIVTDAGEADLGALLGWAFPAHLGGPLSAIDAEGAAAFSQRMHALTERYGPRFDVPAIVHRQVREGTRFH